MSEQSDNRSYIKVSLLVMMVVFSLGGLFGYSIHPETEIVVETNTITETIEIEVPVNVTVEVPADRASFTMYNYLITNEKYYVWIWENYTANEKNVPEANPTNESFVIFYEFRTVNAFPLEIHSNISVSVYGGGFPFRSNVSINCSRLMIQTYNITRNNTILPQSYSVFNGGMVLKAEGIDIMRVIFFGSCSDLDAIDIYFLYPAITIIASSYWRES